jgi:dienelactone hydrolase
MLLAAACGSSGARPRSVASSTSATSGRMTLPACLQTRPAPRNGYALGTRTVTFVDHSRPTAAVPRRSLAAHPYRRITVTIVYPAVGRPGGKVLAGAMPSGGLFPLVVASHGVTGTGPQFAGLLLPWARAGYVIAAPTYPLSSGPGADIDDLPHQPGDIAFVVRSLRTMTDAAADPLHDHVEVSCLALAGHSLGAATTLEAAYERGFEVPGVRAVVSMAGILAAIPPGGFEPAPPTPLLLIHGDVDTTVPISGSQNAFRVLRGPRWFVTMHGADHNTIFLPPYGSVLDAAAIAFLDAQLKGQPAALGALGEVVARSHVASLQRAA